MKQNISVTKEIATQTEELNKIGIEFFEQSNLTEAKKIADKLIAIGTKNNFVPAMIRGYNLTGNIHSYYYRYDVAIQDFLHASKLSEQLKNPQFSSQTLGNIGRCYGLLGDFSTSITYFQKAITYSPKNESNYNNLGVSLLRMNKLDEALKYLLISYDLNTRDPNQESAKRHLATTCMNIGNIYYQKKDFSTALDYFSTAMDFAEKFKQIPVQSRIYQYIGNIYADQKKYEFAEKNLKKSLELATEIDDYANLLESYYKLALLFRDQKKYSKAFYFIEKFVTSSFSVNKREMNTMVQNLQKKFEEERKLQEEEHQKLKKRNREIQEKMKQLQSAYARVSGVGNIGVFSDKIRNVVRMAEYFHKDRNVPVLIEGETGTGKEIIARIVHYGHGHRTDPFVVVNCSAISPNLFESELFGYEPGAFTGASQQGRIGKFELAEGGTIFLDEIGDLPMELQPKLLRVLQQKEFYRVGGNKEIRINVRIICATNRKLKELIKEKGFRSDLYYRLNTGRIYLPPLRERQEEIIPLATLFMKKFSMEKKRNFTHISQKAAKILENYSWPGNIRELQNAVERVVILHNDSEIIPEHLAFMREDIITQETHLPQFFSATIPDQGYSLREMEDRYILYILDQCDGNKTRAAKMLNISRNYFYR